MARLMRPVLRALSTFASPRIGFPLEGCRPIVHTRHYIGEMAKMAFESNILRLLRIEMDYHKEYAPFKLPSEFGRFQIEDRPGELWIRLRGKFGNENIKIEATTFDGTGPASKSGEGDEVRLHLSMIVDISKEGDDTVLQIICSVWPESVQIEKVFMSKQGQMIANPFTGPDFATMDDELQSSMEGYLAERGIDDELAGFLHEYMTNKDKIELIHWMGQVKSFVEK